MLTPDAASDDPFTRSLSRRDLPDEPRSLRLLAQAQAGDNAALAELIGRYQDRLRRIVRIQLAGSRLRHDLDSMDIVQSTFQAALPRIGEMHPESAASLLSWLARIATNRIRDAHAWKTAAKRDPAREVPLDALGSGSLSELPAARGTSPEDQAMLEEVRALLDDEVARLPDDWQRVVVLRDYCGEDWDRVAADLDRSIGATKQLHQRAWIELRRALRPKLGGEGPNRRGGQE